MASRMERRSKRSAVKEDNEDSAEETRDILDSEVLINTSEPATKRTKLAADSSDNVEIKMPVSDDANFITIELGEGIATLEEDQEENKNEDETQSGNVPNMQPVVILNDIKILTSETKANQVKKRTKGGQKCCIPGCKSGAMENIIYHTFPKDPDLMVKWLKACGRYPPSTGMRVENLRVCSLHFSDSCYERDLRNELLGLPVRKRLLPDAVPTQFVVETDVLNESEEQTTSDKLEEQKRKELVESLLSDYDSTKTRSEESDDYAENESSPRKRSLKRPAALRDYVTEDKESTTTRYIENDEEDENEDYLVGKVQKAYQNLKRIQTKDGTATSHKITPKRIYTSMEKRSNGHQKSPMDHRAILNSVDKALTAQLKVLQAETEKQKEQLRVLRQELKDYKTTKFRKRIVKEELMGEGSTSDRTGYRLTDIQVELMLNKNLYIGPVHRWSITDVVRGIIFYQKLAGSIQGGPADERAVGALYNKLTHIPNVLLPLPNIRFLKDWLKKFRCNPGIQHSSLQILNQKIQSEPPGSLVRTAVIVLDEIDICQNDYIKGFKDSNGPSVKGKGVQNQNGRKREQVFIQSVMVRGLCSPEDWKFPLFVDFDRKTLNHDLLVQLIEAAEDEAGLEVCAVLFDVEKDADLIADLGLTEERTWFPNPKDASRNVYCFTDIRSVITMQTEALLNEGIEIEQEGSSKNCRLGRSDFTSLQKQLNMEKNSEIRKKLEDSCGLPNLRLVNEEQNQPDPISRRESVLPSIQLLSRSTANAMRQLFDQKEKQAAWIYLWSEFLEVMTSSSIEKSERSGVLTGNNEIKGFGHSNLEEQVQIIEHMLSTIKGTKVIKDAVSAARSRESSPMIRSPGGLRPFQRGIIWSINSIKYLYNDLVRRNGDIDNLILLHQANEPNLFRCLDMDRLSYVDHDSIYHALIQDVNSMSAESVLETAGDITNNLPLSSTLIQAENGDVIVEAWNETDSAIASIIEGKKTSNNIKSTRQTSTRNKSRPYNYNPLKALLPTHTTTLISSGSPTKRLEKSHKRKSGIGHSSETRTPTQKRLGSPTPWNNSSRTMEYIPPAGSKIHIPADHPQLQDLQNKENLEIIGNDDSGVSIIYTDANGQLIQNQTLPSLTTVTLSGDAIPIEQFVETRRKPDSFDVGDIASGIIGQNIIQQKASNSVITRKVVKPTKKQKQKSRRQRQHFDADATSEDENSDDIEYDDSDNNAAVAGADEADSVGETEDTARELQGLQDVQQVVKEGELITYQTQHEYQNQEEVQYETVAAEQILQQTEGQPVAQFYIQQAIPAGVGEDGEEVLQYQYIPIEATSLNATNPELQQYYVQQ